MDSGVVHLVHDNARATLFAQLILPAMVVLYLMRGRREKKMKTTTTPVPNDPTTERLAYFFSDFCWSSLANLSHTAP